MINALSKIIKEPHPDIELGYDRNELEYFLTFPEDGVRDDTGIIFSICGFGEQADSDYQTNVLRPQLANLYNCVAVGVNYFGINRAYSLENFDFINSIRERYNLSLSPFFDQHGNPRFRSIRDLSKTIFGVLMSRGINDLDWGCLPLLKPAKEYNSFGFLPAIDHLQVLGHILFEYPLNKSRIIACGSDYGGYIASLLGKYAPHTFSAIVDLNGYSKANIFEVVGRELLYPGIVLDRLQIGSSICSFNGVINDPWALSDELQPGYFSDSHRSIRSLLIEGHRTRSETKYFMFHDKGNQLAPIMERSHLAEMLKKYNELKFEELDKTDDQPYNLLDILVDLAEKHINDFNKSRRYTDFDIGSSNVFASGKINYRFQFRNDYRIEVTTRAVQDKSSVAANQ